MNWLAGWLLGCVRIVYRTMRPTPELKNTNEFSDHRQFSLLLVALITQSITSLFLSAIEFYAKLGPVLM